MRWRIYLLGFFSGVVFAVLSYISYQSIRYVSFKNRETTLLVNVVEDLMQDTFENIRICGIRSGPPEGEVHFAYDRLYKVNVTYELGGQFKTIELNVGVVRSRLNPFRRAWIVPREMQLLQLNDTAKVLYDRSRSKSAPLLPDRN